MPNTLAMLIMVMVHFSSDKIPPSQDSKTNEEEMLAMVATQI